MRFVLTRVLLIAKVTDPSTVPGKARLKETELREIVLDISPAVRCKGKRTWSTNINSVPLFWKSKFTAGELNIT